MEECRRERSADNRAAWILAKSCDVPSRRETGGGGGIGCKPLSPPPVSRLVGTFCQNHAVVVIELSLLVRGSKTGGFTGGVLPFL